MPRASLWSGESRPPSLLTSPSRSSSGTCTGTVSTPGNGAGTAATCSGSCSSLLRDLMTYPPPAPTPAIPSGLVLPVAPALFFLFSPLARSDVTRSECSVFHTYDFLTSQMQQYSQGPSRDLIYNSHTKPVGRGKHDRTLD